MKKTLNEIAFRWRAKQLHARELTHYIQQAKNIPRVVCKDRVVVTFTTIPERIDSIDVMLKSLLDQSALPDQIYLCIPKKSRLAPHTYDIPAWLRDIPLLEILEVEDDLGPITKLIPALKKEKQHPDTRIIVVDDDGLYPKTLIQTLVEWSNKIPGVSLGCSGVSVPTGLLPSNVLLSSEPAWGDLRLTPKSSSALSKVDYLFGYAGVLVKPRFFSEAIYDYEGAPRGAFFEDDLWIGGNLYRSNIDRYVIPSRAVKLMPGACKKTLDTRALCTTDNKDGRNMDDVYQYLFRHHT